MIHDRSLVYADGAFSARIETTPEGYLYCRDVPIARTGVQDYLNEEIPEVEGGTNGVIKVERPPEEVFRDATIRSFEGKDVTDDHPDDGPVGPHNFKDHVVGTVLNPRRGEGPLADCIVADLLIKDAAAIAAVKNRKREVSCGYDADYESLGPGRARQRNIVGNHVALVDRGRCGSRCSIGDESMKNWKDKVMTLLSGSASEAAFRQAVTDAEGAGSVETEGGVHVHLHGVENETTAAPTNDEEKEAKEREERIKKVEDGLDLMRHEFKGLKDALPKMIKDAVGEKEETDEHDEEPVELKERKENDKKGTKDAAGATFQSAVAGAEILSPGIRVPSFDAADAKKTADSLCLLRRRALTAFAHTGDGAAILRQVLSADSFDPRMPCAALTPVFNAAVALKKAANGTTVDLRAAAAPSGKTTKDGEGPPATIAELNTRNRKLYAKK